MAKIDKYCTPEELEERKKKRKEREAKTAELLAKKKMYAEAAADNRARTEAKHGKQKPKGRGKSLVIQHFEKKERMDKKNIPMSRRNYKIPPVIVLQLLEAGFGPTDIAALLQVSRSTITRLITKHCIDTKMLRAYSKNKAAFLDSMGLRIMSAISEKDLEKATLRDKATSYNIFNNASRLERGQSTQEVNLGIAGKSIKELDEKEAALRAQLEELTGNKVEDMADAEEAEIVKREEAPAEEPQEEVW